MKAQAIGCIDFRQYGRGFALRSSTTAIRRTRDEPSKKRAKTSFLVLFLMAESGD
jgi:hypothetical protein